MTVSQPGIGFARAAIDGSDQAIDDLARAWLPTVYAWCHRLGGPGIDAEGAAHDVLMVMCRRVADVRTPESFPSWLFGTCRRVIANHRRRAWLRRWVPGPVRERAAPGAGPERHAEAREAADIVWTALDKLPTAQREVLVLCELEERSQSEAAGLLGVPLGTVKSRLRSARRAFRAEVEASGRAPGRDASRAVEVG